MFDEKALIAQMEQSRKEFEKRSKELIPVRMKIMLEGFTSETSRFEIAPDLILRKAELDERQAFWSRTNNPKDIEYKADENEFFVDFDFSIPRGEIHGLAPANGINLVSVFFSLASSKILNISRGNFYFVAGDELQSAGFYTTPNEYRFTEKTQFRIDELNFIKELWPHFKSQFEANFSFALVARRYFYSQLRLSLDDRFIDLMISLEALLVPEKSGTKGDKIAERLALILSPEYDREEVESLAHDAYRIRNKIIHGGNDSYAEAFDIDLMSKYCRIAIQKYLINYRGLSSNKLVKILQAASKLKPNSLAQTNNKDVRKHDRIQMAIVSTCNDLGIKAIQEYGGHEWRADVYVPNNGKPIAFEIQLSLQSLKRTLERQAKYIRDGIIGCWLFESPVSKLNEERPDLPLFYVEDIVDSDLQVNLGDRRKVDLRTFLQNFISNNIQFKSIAKTKRKQLVSLVFYKMECWKCKEMNHLFYVDTPFYAACNAKIQPSEALWESSSMEYRPEIIALANKFVESRKDLDLKLGAIKNRYSKTVEDSYTSFGCYKCDSIFGDWYVMEAKIDIIYEPKELTYQGEIELEESVELPIQHWCFPDDNHFCDKA